MVTSTGSNFRSFITGKEFQYKNKSKMMIKKPDHNEMIEFFFVKK